MSRDDVAPDAALRGESPLLRAHSHSPEAVRRRLDGGAAHSYVKDFVFGAVDGAVTTFAVVSGVAGAGLSTGVIIVLGIANLVGDGFSMAAGNFLGVRAEREYRDKVRRMEEQHIDAFPDGEREEVRQIFARKGFAGGPLDQAVEVITSDRARWIETMLREEHGLSLHGAIPTMAAAATFAAFVLVGMVPLLPFIANYGQPGLIAAPFMVSTLMTAAAFFGVGAVKGKFVETPWFWSGLETLLVGGGAAALAYLCGAMLESLA